MAYRYFSLDSIPDLSLSKYSSLAEKGVDGVLKKISSFLRQLHLQGMSASKDGVLPVVYFHLLYIFGIDEISFPKGNRLKVFLIASGEENNLQHTQELIINSAISSFFDIKHGKQVEDNIKKISKKYKYMSALGKREFTIKSSIDKNKNFYKVAQWGMNGDARLYDMFKLMQGFEQPVAFRVDIYPVDYTHILHTVEPLKELRNWISDLNTKQLNNFSLSRDENAEETLRYYESLIEDYESSPHFRANILAFADDKNISEYIIGTACSESLDSGNFSIKTQSGEEIDVYYSMNEPVDIAGTDAQKFYFLPNLYLLEELRPFFTFPALYDGEVIELPKETAPPSFMKEHQKIKLGVDSNGFDVYFPIKLIKKHAFLAGVPGSGKTNSMLHIATSLWIDHKIPFLIFEPAKKEYRTLSRLKQMDELLIFSPASGTQFPLHINPFEFPFGMSLSEHSNNLMSVFEGAFQLGGPAPFLIDSAIESIYRKHGWFPHNINKGDIPYPTVSELYDELSIKVEEAGYQGEIKSNLKSFLEVRLGSLLRREMGDLFDVSESTISPEEWLKRPVLIELEAMGAGPANFLTLLLATLIRESLKVIPKNESDKKQELRHVIFFEEAHNLIGPEAIEVTGDNADPKLAATAFIVKMLAEVRALKEGIIIADQLPTKMAPEVIKNTGLKIGHRITAQDDRQLLGSTMSANAVQLEQMATYGVGEALVTFEDLLRPFKIQFCKWIEDNNNPLPDDELLELFKATNHQGYQFLIKRSAEITHTKFFDTIDKINVRIIDFQKRFSDFQQQLEFYKNLKIEFNGTDTTEEIKSDLERICIMIQSLYEKIKAYTEQNIKFCEQTKSIRNNLFNCINNLRNYILDKKDNSLKNTINKYLG